VISLRPAVATVDQPRWSAPPESALARPTILLVEDEDTLRKLIQLVLRNAGYTVLAAGRGDEALALSERFAPRIHLLVSDLVLPESDGQNLARRLLEKRPDLKVLFISGHPLDFVPIEPRFQFLQKPFAPARLLEIVKKILSTTEAQRHREHKERN
jgi:two-component system, cell cycle sensor histidine kinase and response regulator CckA